MFSKGCVVSIKLTLLFFNKMYLGLISRWIFKQSWKIYTKLISSPRYDRYSPRPRLYFASFQLWSISLRVVQVVKINVNYCPIHSTTKKMDVHFILSTIHLFILLNSMYIHIIYIIKESEFHNINYEHLHVLYYIETSSDYVAFIII